MIVIIIIIIIVVVVVVIIISVLRRFKSNDGVNIIIPRSGIMEVLTCIQIVPLTPTRWGM